MDKSDWIESARGFVNGNQRLVAAQGISNVRDFLARKESQLPARDYTAVFTRYMTLNSYLFSLLSYNIATQKIIHIKLH